MLADIADVPGNDNCTINECMRSIQIDVHDVDNHIVRCALKLLADIFLLGLINILDLSEGGLFNTQQHGCGDCNIGS